MLALDVLKATDIDSIMEEFKKIPYMFSDIEMMNISDEEKELYIERLCVRYRDEFKNIINMEVTCKNQNEILFLSELLSEEERLDLYIVDLSKRKDVENAFNYKKIEDFKNPLYGIALTKREDVLSLKVSQVNIDKYGLDKLAAYIFFNCVTFYIENKQRDNFIDEAVKSLINQSMEDAIDADEFFDDLYKELGIEREVKTEEEIENDRLHFVETMKTRLSVLKADTLNIIEKEI